HTVCMSVAFATKPTAEQALEVLRAWTGHEAVRGLPSAPEPALIIRGEADRPQPRRDAHAGRGMSTTIGRVRADTLLDLKLVAMSHNVVRGAAGGSILNAELLVKSGRLAGLARS
ncbi:MAG: Asd/ArgC dimerization domain-containing protein, partial [Gemmatimonas sp.]